MSNIKKATVASIKEGATFKYQGRVRPVDAKGVIGKVVKVKGTFEAIAKVEAGTKGCLAAENRGNLYLLDYKQVRN